MSFSTLVRYAACAALAAAFTLTGCSNAGSQFGPSIGATQQATQADLGGVGRPDAAQSSLVPTSGATQSAAFAKSAAGSADVRPLEKICEPIVKTGVGWQYVGGTINKWFEWDGPWTYGAYNQLVPCNGDTLLWSGPIAPPWGPWMGQSTEATAWFGGASMASTLPESSSVAIVKTTAKATKVLESIDTWPYIPVDVAVSANGTMYVSVIPPSGGSETACIVVYPRGSTTSSGMLSDERMAQSEGAIGVDKQGDVYVAYTLSGSGETSTQIDKVPSGSTKAVAFASIADASAGSLAVTKSGEILVSTIGASSGEVAILSPKGQIIGKIATTANPTSIALNGTDKTLTVSDSTADLVSTYAYPGGALKSQASMGDPSQTWEPGGLLAP
jgi:hypothetical protein